MLLDEIISTLSDENGSLTSPDNSRLVTEKSHRVSNLCYRSGVQALL